MAGQRGQAQWFWIMISMIIALVVAIFILVLFTDFGAGIRESFDDISSLAKSDNVPSPYDGLDELAPDSGADDSSDGLGSETSET
jgi:hypothetical protein